MFMAMEVNLGLAETLKVSYTEGTQLQFHVGCWGVIEGQMYIAVMSTHFTSQVTYSPSWSYMYRPVKLKFNYIFTIWDILI